MLKAGIVGVGGYTGFELVRLCDRHPGVSLEYLGVRQESHQKLGDLYPRFSHVDVPLTAFDPKSIPELDVLFLALPHGVTHANMQDIVRNESLRVIDLSADYRLSDPGLFESYYTLTHQNPGLIPLFSYGIPELFRDHIKQKKHCANPGCYATCAILALHPLSKAGILTGTAIIDAKSGVSGAGKTLKESSLYCQANENFSSYGTFRHRHTAEIIQTVGPNIFFSPHLVPMDRGIMCSVYVDNPAKLSESEVVAIFKKTFQDEPFIRVFDHTHPIGTKDVTNTNECHIAIHVHEGSNKIVIFSVLDNLMKGAASQAVQNMNVMFGFSEKTGLN